MQTNNQLRSPDTGRRATTTNGRINGMFNELKKPERLLLRDNVRYRLEEVREAGSP